MSTRSRHLAVAATAATALLVAGCGDVSPGAAATVDGTRIARETVDEFARAACAADSTYAELTQQQFTATPTAVYRQQVLTVLVNEQIAEQAAAERDLEVPPSAYDLPEDSELTRLFDALDADDEAAYRDYFGAFLRYRAVAVAIGAEDDPSLAGNEEGAFQAGQQALAEYADEQDVELDPRFGDYAGGQVVGGSGSLSVPAPGEGEPTPAEDEPAQPTPTTPDVADLPDSQVCL